MKRFVFAALSILLVLGSVNLVAAQDQGSEQYVELMRQDIRAQATAIFTEAMMLTDAQGEIFWPIYRDYKHQVSTIGDARIALIKEYAAKYNTMDDATANGIMDKVLKLNKERNSLREKYYKKMRKDLGGVLAARFFQIDRILNEIIDLQVSAELPLVQHTAAPAQE